MQFGEYDNGIWDACASCISFTSNSDAVHWRMSLVLLKYCMSLPVIIRRRCLGEPGLNYEKPDGERSCCDSLLMTRWWKSFVEYRVLCRRCSSTHDSSSLYRLVINVEWLWELQEQLTVYACYRSLSHLLVQLETGLGIQHRIVPGWWGQKRSRCMVTLMTQYYLINTTNWQKHPPIDRC